MNLEKVGGFSSPDHGDEPREGGWAHLPFYQCYMACNSLKVNLKFEFKI